MVMPAVENGPWRFYLNKVYYDLVTDNVAKKIMWALKDSIAYFAEWAVVASSNGTVFSNIGAGGDVDHWDSYLDVVKTKSWVVLENSTTSEQLLIHAYHTTNIIYFNIHYSATGAYNADGGLTTPPTTSESVELHSGALSGTSPQSIVVHSMISADGLTTRVYMMARQGASYTMYGNVLLLEEMYDPPAYWTSTYKRCAYVSTQRGGTYPAQIGPVFTDMYPKTAFNVYIDDGISPGWHTGGVSYIGVEDPGLAIIPIQENYYTLGTEGHSSSPLTLFKNTPPFGGGLGRFKDLYTAPANLRSLTTVDSTGSREWIKCGGLLLPWDGVSKTYPPY